MTTELRINLPREPQDRDLIDMAAQQAYALGRQDEREDLREAFDAASVVVERAAALLAARTEPSAIQAARVRAAYLEGVEEGALRSLEAEAAARVVQVRRKAAR